MTVKDYLQSLTDENKIHVEKIGSGNWYWSFASEETALRRTELAKLRAEYTSVQANVEELGGKVKVAREEKGEGEDKDEKEELVKGKEVLGKEVEDLRKELEGYRDADPGEVDRKKREVEGFRMGAERWTDNLYVVESYLGKIMGGDKEGMEGLRRMVYGDEYVEGEGLAEL